MIPIHRFGDLVKMCISSSLGGGFWDCEKGALLKNFLQMNYPMYCLSVSKLREVDEIFSKPAMTLNNAHDINNCLINQGVKFSGNPKSKKALVKIEDHVYHHHYYYTESTDDQSNYIKSPCTII